jgi:hypothetical protein
MTNGAQTRECWLGLPWRSSRLLGVLLGSLVFWALRWTTPGMILRKVAS